MMNLFNKSEVKRGMKKFILMLLLLTGAVYPQKKDPDKILKEVIDTFNKVQDYSVNVKVKVDVPFIKAPDTDAKIYFKQPDKIHFASERFAMVPKEGLDFSPMGLLKEKYTALYVKDEAINGVPHTVIKIIPLEDRGDVILSTLWINEKTRAISKVESATKTSGTFLMEMFYETGLSYPLPSKMVFTFNFKNMMKGRSMDPDEKVKESGKDQKEESTTGKVYINYSGYQVNKGIPDSMFQEKTKK